MFELTIMVQTLCWLLSFFEQTLFTGILRTAVFTDTLSFVLVTGAHVSLHDVAAAALMAFNERSRQCFPLS